MKTTGHAKGLAARVKAVRAELSELQGRTDAAGKLMARNVARDLLVLESRLADAIAPRRAA